MMEGTELSALGLRWLHILSAIVLGGGLVYQRLAVSPLAEQLGADLREAARRRWAVAVMLTTLFLLLSGLVNLILTIRAYKPYEPGLEGNYHALFGIKFLLGLALFFFASILAGRSDNARKFQANARRWLNVCLVLLVLIVCLSGLLKVLREEVLRQNIAAAPALEPPTLEELLTDPVAE